MSTMADLRTFRGGHSSERTWGMRAYLGRNHGLAKGDDWRARRPRCSITPRSEGTASPSILRRLLGLRFVGGVLGMPACKGRQGRSFQTVQLGDRSAMPVAKSRQRSGGERGMKGRTVPEGRGAGGATSHHESLASRAGKDHRGRAGSLIMALGVSQPAMGTEWRNQGNFQAKSSERRRLGMVRLSLLSFFAADFGRKNRGTLFRNLLRSRHAAFPPSPFRALCASHQ